ncbi:MAG: glycoside hydrolase family 38 C-terminal domain-containing protein [Acidimicrobiia bacterium]
MMRVSIVPHTHWDREWYAPFQVYRAQLVPLLDGLLDLLEQDPSARRFLLDGQTSVVDDYLEVRPEAAARLARLVAEERLAVGPWMVLMDEFMVSGETIVRDLQLGIARTRELGGSVTVGYLPDMFGHVAQMPQLLRLAGIEHAVVWRGVPAAIDRTAFWWDAPDGSRVRAEYLYGSYSNGRDLPRDPALLVARARGYAAELGDAALLDGGSLLLMNGSDHLAPQRHLGALVAAANESQEEFEFGIASLAEHVAAQPVDGLPVWNGELRSGARANVLMGVASNRVDVHQAAGAAERALERRAEPLSALLLAPDAFPHALLGIAWRNVVLNSAHDSSCACSHDEVVEAVRVRYQEARHIGEALSRDALTTLAARVDAPPSSTVVANTVARARGGLVRLSVAGTGPVHVCSVDDGTCHAAQVVGERSGRGLDTVVVGRKIGWVLEMMRGPELAGARITRVEHTQRDDGVEAFTFHDAAPGDPELDLETTREELHALGEAGATIAVHQLRAPTRDVVAAVPEVPGFGWRTFTPVDGDMPDATHPDPHDPKFVGVEGDWVLDNGLVRVEVDPGDGTLTIEADDVRVTGANRYVDGGDGGDTYNYSPPALDAVVDTPESVAVEVLERGPVRAQVLVLARYRWPARAIGDEHSCRARSAETEPVEVRTTLELRTGERFVRVRVDLDHRTRDHRLRAHVPLPAAVTSSHAECAFAVVERGLTAEGGPHEAPLPTFVSRRFVDCSGDDPASWDRVPVGVALLHDGLLEYEVVADGRELALTLLRATGYLSRSEPALRPNPAGPLDPLEGPQLQRPLTLEYAILPHRGDWRAAGIADAADDFLVPLERVRGGGWPGADLPPVGHALEVEGARVSALTRDAAGALVVRLVNLSPDPATARAARDGRTADGEVIDLVGRVLAPFRGSIELRPWEIVTLRLG